MRLLHLFIIELPPPTTVQDLPEEGGSTSDPAIQRSPSPIPPPQPERPSSEPEGPPTGPENQPDLSPPPSPPPVAPKRRIDALGSDGNAEDMDEQGLRKSQRLRGRPALPAPTPAVASGSRPRSKSNKRRAEKTGGLVQSRLHPQTFTFEAFKDMVVQDHQHQYVSSNFRFEKRANHSVAVLRCSRAGAVGRQVYPRSTILFSYVFLSF